MRSTFTAVLATALVLSFAPAATADGKPGPCVLHAIKGETVKAHSRRMIRCAVGRWPVRGGATKAICIAKRESGLIPTASSATGLYLGLYQHSADMWPDRYDRWTKPAWQLRESALNGRTNAIVTIRMVHTKGWGPWKGPGC